MKYKNKIFESLSSDLLLLIMSPILKGLDASFFK